MLDRNAGEGFRLVGCKGGVQHPRRTLGSQAPLCLRDAYAPVRRMYRQAASVVAAASAINRTPVLKFRSLVISHLRHLAPPLELVAVHDRGLM